MLITEPLSIPRLVTRGGVAISWLIISVICVAVYFKIERSASVLPFHPQNDVAPEGDGLDENTKGLRYPAGVIVVLVGVTALIAPLSNLDAMSYHMARAAMWICNHNVGFFPTANYTQLIYGAFAEYSMMHTMLLWGNDRFVNVVHRRRAIQRFHESFSITDSSWPLAQCVWAAPYAVFRLRE